MAKKLRLFIKGDLFKCAEQPDGIDSLPEDFAEAQLLLKESKDNIKQASILLGNFIEARFDPQKIDGASQLVEQPNEILASSVKVENAKFSKKTPIPRVTVSAIFEIALNNEVTRDLLMKQLGDWVAGATFRWNIEFWGVDGLNLQMNDPDSSYILIDNME